MTSRVVGFTGSRAGLTDAQKNTVAQLLKWIKPAEVHHGEGVGADAIFHDIVRQVLPQCHIIGHPPKVDTFQAKLQGYYREEPRKGFLKRDDEIVDLCDILIGCPKSAKTFQVVERYGGNPYRGGTWYTINYAQKKGKEVVIVKPDGSIDRQEARVP